jgi:DNA/RNA endonuclease YhcR with UshA esterase domain
MWLLLVLAGATIVVSQQQNPPAQHNYKYEFANQVTVEGIVADARDYNCPVSGAVGSHIVVKTAGSEIEAHLAPATFIKQFEINIHKGDKVTVVGSRIDYEGKPALIARSVTVANDTYHFRDDKGRPLW